MEGDLQLAFSHYPGYKIAWISVQIAQQMSGNKCFFFKVGLASTRACSFVEIWTNPSSTLLHLVIIQKMFGLKWYLKWFDKQGIEIAYFSDKGINNSLHLARKYARIFVRGHYLFREANSFPRAKLEENCELRGTDNVQGQISEHIFKAKLRLLCLLSFKYFSQQAGSASPSYVITSKFVNWLPKPCHSIFISRI